MAGTRNIDNLDIPIYKNSLVMIVHRSITANTEYNQLGPLLVALGGEGDVADGATGFSPYPGNINQVSLVTTE